MRKPYIVGFFLFVLIFSISGNLSAQQDPQYSQYMFNKLAYNPAYAGSENAVSTTILFRNQWIDFDGHPVTQVLSSHAPVNSISSGIGLHVVNDLIGVERTLNIKLSYAYILRMKGGNISFGLGAGVMKKSLDGSKLRSPSGQYQPDPINHNDPLIPDVNVSTSAVPDMDFGVYFKNDDIEGGFSATHLVSPKFKYNVGGASTEVTQVKNYYFLAGYRYAINDRADLKPSIKVKTDGVKTQVDLNALLVYNGNIWAGLSYRGINNKDNNDAMVAVAGLNLTPNLIFGYSYDITTSALRGAGSGSHEFMLNYKFVIIKPSKPEKVIYCPRYL